MELEFPENGVGVDRVSKIYCLYQIQKAADLHPGLLKNVRKCCALNRLMSRNCQFQHFIVGAFAALYGFPSV